MPALTTSPSPTTGLSLPRFEDQDCRSALKILIWGVMSGQVNKSLQVIITAINQVLHDQESRG